MGYLQLTKLLYYYKILHWELQIHMYIQWTQKPRCLIYKTVRHNSFIPAFLPHSPDAVALASSGWNQKEESDTQHMVKLFT